MLARLCYCFIPEACAWRPPETENGHQDILPIRDKMIDAQRIRINILVTLNLVKQMHNKPMEVQ